MALGTADRLLKSLALSAGLLVVAVSSTGETQELDGDGYGKKALLTRQLVDLSKSEETCINRRISCGLGVRSMILTTDCALDDGTFVDFWIFEGTVGEEVTVKMKSVAFDTFLFLLDPTPEVVATDDDSGFGTDSEISYTLGATGEWSVATNNLLPLSGDPGIYTLELACRPVRGATQSSHID